MEKTNNSQDSEVQGTTRTSGRRRVTRVLLVITLILGVLIVPRVLAHGVIGGSMGGGHEGNMQRNFVIQVVSRLPLGTQVGIDLFNEDPTEGAVATATFDAEVGVTSESALAAEVEASLAEVNYVQIRVGERTERIVLPNVEQDEVTHRMRNLPIPLMASGEGETITVAFFASEDASTPTETLRFTQGVDSAAAFQASLETALTEAAVVEVTLPAETRTIDLARGSRDQRMRPDIGHARGPEMGQRMGGQPERGTTMMQRDARGVHPMASRGPGSSSEMGRGMPRGHR